MSPSSNNDVSAPDLNLISEWSESLGPNCALLRELAGTTEDEFLRIGAKLQDLYLKSSEITAQANRLVELVSGEQSSYLIDRLRRILSDMKGYLDAAGAHRTESCRMLENILDLLSRVSQPLEGFQKMTKTLRMLGISTKIESSRLGELGAGFLTLALDVEKLSHMVNSKSTSIQGHRQQLSNIIAENLTRVRRSDAVQSAELTDTLNATSANLQELVSVNERCREFGSTVSTVSAEVSDHLSQVVASMQMHDMVRQQVEHIIEALEKLEVHLAAQADNSDNQEQLRIVSEVGDVCELQSAQLRHAADELVAAVHTIISSLRDMASKQSAMATESLHTSGGSFLDLMRDGLDTVASILTTCSSLEEEMAETTSRVSETMVKISGFVSDIEEIGSEIDLIALNSQVKAAHTGREGAALGVLAEAIKRLSVDALSQTRLVSDTLTKINSDTVSLCSGSTDESERMGQQVSSMNQEVSSILDSLSSVNIELTSVLSALSGNVSALSADIEQATSGIDVHERVVNLTDEVEGVLNRIVVRAREIAPASSEFIENLRFMEQRYTMESERRIHEALARKRGIGFMFEDSPAAVVQTHESGSAEESEFGDNVDLF